MDTSFWTTLLLGALLSLAGSFVANIYTDRAQQYLSARRQIRLSSKKANELNTYAFVKALKVGDPLAMLEQQAQSERVSIAVTLCVLANTLAILLEIGSIKFPNDMVAKIGPLPMLLFGALSLIFGIAINTAAARNRWKAKHLDQYERDIRGKWGADAI